MNKLFTHLPFKITGTGHYLPLQKLSDLDLDRMADYPSGTTDKKTGVRYRYWRSEKESQAFMGSQALLSALEKSNDSIQNIDCIVCASGTSNQPLPCTASAIQKELGAEALGIPCFDIDATCLSFVTALNLMASTLTTGQYHRVAIISSEITSEGLNFEHVESAGLFGDGAAACIIEETPHSNTGMIGYHMATDARYNHICSIRGGGTDLPAKYYTPETKDAYLFQMDGPLLLKRMLRTIKPFLNELYTKSGITQQEIQCVVPHQASPKGMEVIRRFLGFRNDQWISIVRDHGNCVAASIPMALDIALSKQQISKGDTVLLLGTGAGIALAGSIIKL